MDQRVAVLVPCFNEATTIADVVAGFRAALPEAVVYVYDNASTDDTARLARQAGAVVRAEPDPGKGNVVRRMFADVDADLYVMTDGDATYDPTEAPTLLAALAERGVDMVVGARRGVHEDAGRSGHAFGNRLFNRLYRWLFGDDFTDVFSGYRVFTRRFVKSFPAVSTGFEIETEMSVHASQLRIPTVEVPVSYGARPDGSESKLSTVRDGARILVTFGVLTKETRPLLFFGVVGTVVGLVGVGLGIPLVVDYLETGLVERLPTAVIIVGLLVVATLSLLAGVILDSLARWRVEQKRLAFLREPPQG
jgi:glycosyltransferase involved in cell wall biosynthesis